eukprot:1191878-Rhodomonas_salina.3
MVPRTASYKQQGSPSYWVAASSSTKLCSRSFAIAAFLGTAVPGCRVVRVFAASGTNSDSGVRCFF